MQRMCEYFFSNRAKRPYKMKLKAILKFYFDVDIYFYKNFVKPETLTEVEMGLKMITVFYIGEFAKIVVNSNNLNNVSILNSVEF